MTRSNRLKNLEEGDPLDVLVIGGGISGAAVYHELCCQGFRTGLVDRGDFASGTSQSSGLMVWGGLLYLRKFDIQTVMKLCRARDDLIRRMGEEVSPGSIRYLTAKSAKMPPWFVLSGLHFYWLLGSRERRFPRKDTAFLEQGLLQPDLFASSLTYEEAFLCHSDSRFVLQWISGLNGPNCIPANHCSFMDGHYTPGDRLWHIRLKDQLTRREFPLKAREVINCGGVLADEINRSLGIESPYRHVFSKGVYLMFRRNPAHEKALVMETGQNGAVLTYVPWGPVAMWGPTETAVTDLAAGFQPDIEDIRYLLHSANRFLKNSLGPQDIVSIRCGVRPLAVRKEYNKSVYPLELSRKYLVAHDKDKHGTTVYGGKLTAGRLLAAKVARQLRQRARPMHPIPTPAVVNPQYDPIALHDIREVSPSWSHDHEFCETLEDYLRRRTNISQWVERMGLGRASENLRQIRELASAFCSTAPGAQKKTDEYADCVHRFHDQLLRSV